MRRENSDNLQCLLVAVAQHSNTYSEAIQDVTQYIRICWWYRLMLWWYNNSDLCDVVLTTVSHPLILWGVQLVARMIQVGPWQCKVLPLSRRLLVTMSIHAWCLVWAAWVLSLTESDNWNSATSHTSAGQGEAVFLMVVVVGVQIHTFCLCAGTNATVGSIHCSIWPPLQDPLQWSSQDFTLRALLSVSGICTILRWLW